MVTRKEVAALAGVSEATVSRVFNGIGPMKEATRAKVLEAAAQLHYTPNAIAQRLVRKRSGSLGVVLPKLPKVHLFATYYFAEILSGIGHMAAESGYDLLLLFSDSHQENDYVGLFQSRKIDALLLLGRQDTPGDRRAVEELAMRGLPCCVVGQRYDDLPVYAVDADHQIGSYEATSHLAQSGRRSIAFINGPIAYSNSADRLAGYKKALAHHGLPLREDLLFIGNYSRTSGYERAETIAGIDGLDAVFAANDRMALGLLQGLKEKGIPVGTQVALAGYDNSEAARFSDPSLTSVAVPHYEMGRLAVRLLIAELTAKAKDQPYLHKLPVELIVRASSQST